MIVRKQEFDDQVATFINTKAIEAKQEVFKASAKAMLLENNRRIQNERHKKLHEDLLATKLLEQDGDYDTPGGSKSEWARGTDKQEATIDRPQRDDNAFITRNTEQKPAESERPRFKPQRTEDSEMVVRRGTGAPAQTSEPTEPKRPVYGKPPA